MSQQITDIKKRISSIKGAYKITSAMKLVSSVKLKKFYKQMLERKRYVNELVGLTSTLVSSLQEVNNPYFEINKKSNKNLYIIVTSSLGLCGSYNTNIFKLAHSMINKEDDLIVLGNKGRNHFLNALDEFKDANNLADEKLALDIFDFVSESYLKHQYKEIHLICTEYINGLVFKPKDIMLLPFINKGEKKDIDFLVEPKKEVVIDKIIPLYLKSVISFGLYESNVCEQASRSNAMEKATTNAKDLLDDLSIEFNKARQAAITQEIIEIVGASQE